MLITFPIVVCRVFWAGGLSLHLYKILYVMLFVLFDYKYDVDE